MNPDGTAGHCNCDLLPASDISFALPRVPDEASFKGGDTGLCAEFNDIEIAPNTNYAYTWATNRVFRDHAKHTF